MSNPPSASGPDLTQGIGVDDLPRQGMLLGRVGDDPVLLVRRSDRLFAVGATCTHYGGPLAEGIAGAKDQGPGHSIWGANAHPDALSVGAV